MLPFGVTIPATVPQGSEIPEGLMNNPVYLKTVSSFVPNLGHHQSIIIKGSEYTQKLKINEQEISSCTLSYVKTYANNAR
jgi:hypothetical protein